MHGRDNWVLPSAGPQQEGRDLLRGSARCTGDHLGMSHSSVFPLDLSLPGLLATCSVQGDSHET